MCMEPVHKEKNLTVGSLFSGCGGMDMGFRNAGFKVVWANDINSDACQTHRLWSESEIINCDISSMDVPSLPYTDVIIGGFPCQGFSAAGPRDVDDSRNLLYKHFVKCVGVKKPMAFVAENVKGILSMAGGKVVKKIVKDFSEQGYIISVSLLDASDYSVPQERLRVIFVGIREDITGEFNFPKKHDIVMTMKKAIGNMPEPLPEDVCQDSFSSRYMSRDRRRGWSQISFTIPAMAKQVPLHPSSPDMKFVKQDVWEFGEGVTRRLSWREAAAIQTFPGDMEFAGDLTSKYKQIGNAVPVKLAAAVAAEVKKCLEG